MAPRVAAWVCVPPRALIGLRLIGGGPSLPVVSSGIQAFLVGRPGPRRVEPAAPIWWAAALVPHPYLVKIRAFLASWSKKKKPRWTATTAVQHQALGFVAIGSSLVLERCRRSSRADSRSQICCIVEPEQSGRRRGG